MSPPGSWVDITQHVDMMFYFRGDLRKNIIKVFMPLMGSKALNKEARSTMV